MNKLTNNKTARQSSAEIKARLQRAQSQLGHSLRETSLDQESRASDKFAAARKVSQKAKKLCRALGGDVISSSSGEYILLKQFYDTNYVHGHISFGAVAKTSYKLSHFCSSGEESKLIPEEFLFFDTETTGLSGAGAVPFLIGIGSFVRGGFETRQYIIPDFADEAAMLEDMFTEFSPRRTLVSYNGKAFDKPLIEDRLIIHRIARELPQRQHVDLLHTSRSIFKRRLGDCSLGNIERQALGYQREEDIPGYLVPAVYLDWIHNDETSQLTDVIAHNRQDIVSLAALMSLISESFVSAGATLSSALDAYSLMRVCDKRRRGEIRDIALKIGRQREKEFIELGDAEIEFRRSMIFKRAGEIESAVKIWLRLVTGETLRKENQLPAQQARLELAKWCEHRCKDYRQALHLAESGLRFSLKQSPALDDWDKRRRRLQRRIDVNHSAR